MAVFERASPDGALQYPHLHYQWTRLVMKEISFIEKTSRVPVRGDAEMITYKHKCHLSVASPLTPFLYAQIHLDLALIKPRSARAWGEEERGHGAIGRGDR